MAVINQLIYAEMYNLLPWIFLSREVNQIWDEDVHGAGGKHSFLADVIEAPELYDERDENREKPFPGVPDFQRTRKEEVTVFGNGIWNSYFEPVSDFSFDHRCSKPMLTLAKPLVSHWVAPWAVESYPGYLAWEHILNSEYHQWYGQQRRIAHEIVRKYFHPKPWIQKLVDKVNPTKENSICLGLHHRGSDKSGKRRKTHFEQYATFIEAYAQETGGGKIFLATDSAPFLKEIEDKFPPEVAILFHTQENAIRSSNKLNPFSIGSHHRTNTEVMIDMYALAKCDIFLHGRSAVSEAVHYINPKLHDHSVDFEDPTYMSEDAFREMIRIIMREKGVERRRHLR